MLHFVKWFQSILISCFSLSTELYLLICGLSQALQEQIAGYRSQTLSIQGAILTKRLAGLPSVLIKLLIYLCVENSFVSLKRTRLALSFTNKILHTASDQSVKMHCRKVSALDGEIFFSSPWLRNSAVRKTVHSTRACPSISMKRLCPRQTDWVYVGENAQLSVSFHIIFNNWVVKI